MATGQIHLGAVKLGDSADTSKNFLVSVPATDPAGEPPAEEVLADPAGEPPKRL